MKCNCYHVIEAPAGKFRGECWGTKERDQVNCSGYTELCSNGLRKENSKQLLTAEMVIEAAKTLQTYESGDVLYNSEKGFFSKNDGKPWPTNAFNYLNEIFACTWHESEIKVMTKTMAEQEYNIKIIG